MSMDLFRIRMGLEIDNNVRILYGDGIPGSTPNTDAAQVGSFYLSTLNGNAYSKITLGSGQLTWKQIASEGRALYVENAQAPTPGGALGANSLTLGQAAQTAATAHDAVAIGRQTYARLPGVQTFSNGRFGSSGDAQTNTALVRSVTVNNVPTELFLDGTNGIEQLVMPDDSTWMFTANITAHRVDINDGHAGFKIEGVCYRSSGVDTIAILGTPIKTIIASTNVEWDVDVAINDVTGALLITATGQTSKIIRWVAQVNIVEVTN